MRFVSEVIDHLDEEGRLQPFYATYRSDGWGHPAYHPALFPSNGLRRAMFKALYVMEETFPHWAARIFQYPMIILRKLERT